MPASGTDELVGELLLPLARSRDSGSTTGTPSIAFGIARPCQCTVVSFGRPLVTTARRCPAFLTPDLLRGHGARVGPGAHGDTAEVDVGHARIHVDDHGKCGGRVADRLGLRGATSTPRPRPPRRAPGSRVGRSSSERDTGRGPMARIRQPSAALRRSRSGNASTSISNPPGRSTRAKEWIRAAVSGTSPSNAARGGGNQRQPRGRHDRSANKSKATLTKSRSR